MINLLRIPTERMQLPKQAVFGGLVEVGNRLHG